MTRFEELEPRYMFEELGYEYKKTDFEIYYTMEFRDCCDEWYEMGIRFRLSDKTIFCDFEIDMPTLKAINKQCEELGWLGE